jgi:hypothetical protein
MEGAIAPTYNNIGLLYENIGDYDHVIKYLRKSMDICINSWIGQSPNSHVY